MIVAARSIIPITKKNFLLGIFVYLYIDIAALPAVKIDKMSIYGWLIKILNSMYAKDNIKTHKRPMYADSSSM